jgi:hypothetical protein
VGVEKTAGRSTEQHGQRWQWVVQGGCLDPAAIEPYSGGSRSTREEKTARRRNRGPARSPVC